MEKENICKYNKYNNRICIEDPKDGWADPYKQCPTVGKTLRKNSFNFELIPFKNRLIITEYYEELIELFNRLNKMKPKNMSYERVLYFNAVMGQAAQKYLQKKPNNLDGIYNHVMMEDKTCHIALLDEELNNPRLKYENQKKLELMLLRYNIEKGIYGQEENLTKTHYIKIIDKSAYTIKESDIIISTMHYQEVIWLFNQLYSLFEYILTENSKISFIKSIRKKLANYLKENGDPETPYPLLLIMLDQAQKWMKINCKAKAIRSRM